MQHPLLIANDDFWSLQLNQMVQPVVPVDDTSVQVIQVAGSKATPVKLHHGSQVRWDYGQHGQDHPFGPVAGLPKGLDNPQPLGGPLLLLFGAGYPDLAAKAFCHDVQVHGLDNIVNRFGPHAPGEHLAPAGLQFPEADFVQQGEWAQAAHFFSLTLYSLLHLLQVADESVREFLFDSVGLVLDQCFLRLGQR